MPVVPIYIQEKILPQVIIENLRDTARKGEPEPELTLFNDYDGIEFQELVEFYRHEQNWANRMILGDSLLVMTSLAEKEGLKGKVQMIYMDPPYGIKFGSNWQVSTRKRDVKDGKAEDATRQPEQIKAFRDTWELGIHSYLAYLRDRLVVSARAAHRERQHLRADRRRERAPRALRDGRGVRERELREPDRLPEDRRAVAGGTCLPASCDYLLWYAKDMESIEVPPALLREASRRTSEPAGTHGWRLPDGTPTRDSTQTSCGRRRPDGARRFQTDDHLDSRAARTAVVPGRVRRHDVHAARTGTGRRTERAWSVWLPADGCCGTGNTLTLRAVPRRLPGVPAHQPLGRHVSIRLRRRQDLRRADRHARSSQRCMLMATDPGDLVLDPTCGSGTTAHVAEQWGRRWITVDTSRVALALARTRLMGARFPYYVLADSPEGAKREAELTGVPPAASAYSRDVRKGFVYKRVPHITLKSIANNPDIREGMSREEIDAAIRRHADTELLYDQPYEDTSRIRVTGPFTVESLSPHRVLAGGDGGRRRTGRPAKPRRPATPPTSSPSSSTTCARPACRTPSRASASSSSASSPTPAPTSRPSASTPTPPARPSAPPSPSAPSTAPSTPTWVKEAAKEARKGEGFPMLVVCAFAFGPYVGEEAKQWPNLTILITRMNPDLAMDTADQKLLKSTGAGNLFMVFGEPDLELRTLPDGKLQVELRGLDVYDPTTGEIRSDTTDEIACWFIDSDYNEESFFVRHAYFTGADEPYKKLQRALKAEIDEAAWATLYSTVSRPFDPPSTGKIAVKVINHYGDEVLKVYDAGGRV